MAEGSQNRVTETGNIDLGINEPELREEERSLRTDTEQTYVLMLGLPGTGLTA